MTETNPQPTPMRIGILLFPGFQALDVFGPVDAFNFLSASQRVTFDFISSDLSPVSTRSPFQPAENQPTIAQSVLPTTTFSTIDITSLDLLLIPGGVGARVNPSDEEIAFISRVFPNLKYFMTVCTGAVLATKAGVLDGLKATSNKALWEKVVTTPGAEKVKWVRRARWVVDGKVWTSSGVSAGIDMVLAWIEEVYGREEATGIADNMEYVRNEDPAVDHFADVFPA